jgi:hypothetical protein
VNWLPATRDQLQHRGNTGVSAKMGKDTSRGFALLLGDAIAAGLSPSLAQAQSIVDKADRDETAAVAQDDPLMARAMSKARETLVTFLDAAAHPKPGADDFGVKVAIREGDQVEYFWVAPFRRNGESCSGELGNEPRTDMTLPLARPSRSAGARSSTGRTWTVSG